jgi:hypothetical protein
MESNREDYFSVDQLVARRTQDAAQKMGKNLDEALCGYLERLAESNRCDDQWATFEERCLKSSALLGRCRSHRDEGNQG